jgi:hypothetical protein
MVLQLPLAVRVGTGPRARSIHAFMGASPDAWVIRPGSGLARAGGSFRGRRRARTPFRRTSLASTDT